MDPILHLIATSVIGLLLLAAAWSKLSSFRVFVATLADYEIIPATFTAAAGVIVVALEIAIGIAAFIPALTRMAMLAAAALLAVYGLAIAINLIRGRRDIDCGCTGPATRQMISGWLVLRNAGLVTVALLATLPVTARSTGAADITLSALGVVGCAVLYLAINQLMANAPKLDALDDLMEVGDG